MTGQEGITDIDESTDEPTSREEVTALPGFCYRNGYTLSLADLGKAGVKVELIDSNEGSAAVILPLGKTEECSRWLSRTIGQKSYALPHELPRILERLLKWRQPSPGGKKEPKRILERGDKKVIKEALKLLEVLG